MNKSNKLIFVRSFSSEYTRTKHTYTDRENRTYVSRLRAFLSAAIFLLNLSSWIQYLSIMYYYMFSTYLFVCVCVCVGVCFLRFIFVLIAIYVLAWKCRKFEKKEITRRERAMHARTHALTHSLVQHTKRAT